MAQINASAEWDRYAMIQEENGISKQQELEYKNKQLDLNAKQFDAKLKQDNAKLELEKQKAKDDARLKEKQINKQSTNKK